MKLESRLFLSLYLMAYCEGCQTTRDPRRRDRAIPPATPKKGEGEKWIKKRSTARVSGARSKHRDVRVSVISTQAPFCGLD